MLWAVYCSESSCVVYFYTDKNLFGAARVRFVGIPTALFIDVVCDSGIRHKTTAETLDAG